MKVFSGVLILFLAALTVVAGIGCPYSRARCPECTLEANPMCSTFGCTYENLCFLQCDGAELSYKGPCRSSSAHYGIIT